MAKMLRQAAAAIAAIVLASPCWATSFYWSGADYQSFTFGGPGGGHQTISAYGIGSGTLDASADARTGIPALSAFSFAVDFSSYVGQYVNRTGTTYVVENASETVTWGLADVTSFTDARNFSLARKQGSAGLLASFDVADGTGTLNTSAHMHGYISATPLPEPGAWLTLLAGLGLVGAAMRRRSTGSPAATRDVHHRLAGAAGR